MESNLVGGKSARQTVMALRATGLSRPHAAGRWAFVFSFTLLGCGAAPAPIKNGDPLPTAVPDARGCPKGTRWLGSDPNTPLAVTLAGNILDAHACCVLWARRADRWLAIDSWGSVAGVAEVSGGAGSEATECYALELRRIRGTTGSGIFASTDFRGSPSFAWQPSAEHLESLRAFVAHSDAVLASGSDRPPSLEQRTRFFSIRGKDSSEPAVTHYAVVGGWGLLLARLDGARWSASFIDAELHAAAGYVPASTYTIVAVFDMTGDGSPEIVFVRGGDAVWDEDVLHRSSGVWQRARSGVGGSSI